MSADNSVARRSESVLMEPALKWQKMPEKEGVLKAFHEAGLFNLSKKATDFSNVMVAILPEQLMSPAMVDELATYIKGELRVNGTWAEGIGDVSTAIDRGIELAVPSLFKTPGSLEGLRIYRKHASEGDVDFTLQESERIAVRQMLKDRGFAISSFWNTLRLDGRVENITFLGEVFLGPGKPIESTPIKVVEQNRLVSSDVLPERRPQMQEVNSNHSSPEWLAANNLKNRGLVDVFQVKNVSDKVGVKPKSVELEELINSIFWSTKMAALKAAYYGNEKLFAITGEDPTWEQPELNQLYALCYKISGERYQKSAYGASNNFIKTDYEKKAREDLALSATFLTEGQEVPDEYRINGLVSKLVMEKIAEFEIAKRDLLAQQLPKAEPIVVADLAPKVAKQESEQGAKVEAQKTPKLPSMREISEIFYKVGLADNKKPIIRGFCIILEEILAGERIDPQLFYGAWCLVKQELKLGNGSHESTKDAGEIDKVLIPFATDLFKNPKALDGIRHQKDYHLKDHGRPLGVVKVDEADEVIKTRAKEMFKKRRIDINLKTGTMLIEDPGMGRKKIIFY
jgi:hypothetical protein